MKPKRKGLKILMIVLAVVLVLALAFLIFLGANFFGPFRNMKISSLERASDPAQNAGGIVFYGASNFTRWTEIQTDMPGYRIVNHGFGGSTDKDLVQYADRLLFPYNPTIVVFQTGSNDYILMKGTDAEKIAGCMAYKRDMYTQFHARLPDAVFVVMSGLLLPGRSEYADMTIEINRQLEALCAEHDYMIFVDANAMTYQNGSFDTALFVKDGIHLNRDGQQRWANEYILPALDQVCDLLGDRAAQIRR